MHFIANNEASKTHPARMDRLAAIAKGWNKADAQSRGISYHAESSEPLQN